ncbi:MAG: LysR family transcriptional regulator, partial [Clostridia bacterium]|nr:LysR family transcriptional regulator [Clostridia bacterium]
MKKETGPESGKNILDYMQILNQSESISSAAEKCGISQSALSNALKHLEMSLSAHLYDRKAGKMTPAGSLYVKAAERIQATMQECRAALEAMKSGSFIFGIDSCLGNTIDIKLSKHMLSMFPGLRFSIVSDELSALKQRLREGSLDMYIALDDGIEHEGVLMRNGVPLQLYLITPPVTAGMAVSVHELLSSRQLVRLRRSPLTETMYQWLKRSRIEPPDQTVTNSYMMAHILMEQTNAVLAAPVTALSEFRDFTALPIPGAHVLPSFFYPSGKDD